MIFNKKNSLELRKNLIGNKNKNSFDASKLPEWNFIKFYKSMYDSKIEKDLNDIKSDIDYFIKKYKNKLNKILTDNVVKKNKRVLILINAIKKYEDILDKLGIISSYSYLLYAQLSTDSLRIKFLGDMQERLINLETQILFFELELNRIEIDKIDDLLNSQYILNYKLWIKDIRREKPYQLSNKIEKLFAEKSLTSTQAWSRLFDEIITNLRFIINDKQFSIEQILNLMISADAKKRQNAANALSKGLAEKGRLFTHIINVLIKDKSISDNWRGFKEVVDSRHLTNRVESEVIDSLEISVKRAYPKLSHRYYAFKAKWLGVKQLNYWDRNAPILNNIDENISWNDAKKIVLKSYFNFSPKLEYIASKFFDNGWIDARSRNGKISGAFAHPTVPSKHPFIMINYLGGSRDVMTLSHEIGHGIHQYLANEQGLLMSSTPLTLAETASIFSEMLTFRLLLNDAETVEQKRYILSSKIEDMLNTIIRQISFYSFERKIHIQRKNGELTEKQLGNYWLKTSSESLGPSVKLNKGYEHYWSYIPHFIHSSFYVYAYAFGNCLVNSLYACYQHDSKNFVNKYFNLLKSGGSKDYSELLTPFGLNASDEKFWDIGLNTISSLINELESL